MQGNVHGLSNDELEAIRSSGLFDADWYLRTYPEVKVLSMDPLEHFLLFGHRLKTKRHPSPRFDAERYLKDNPDVTASGVNALVHYVLFGRSQGRKAAPIDHPSLHCSTFNARRPYPFLPQGALQPRALNYLQHAAARGRGDLAIFSAVTNHYDKVLHHEHLLPQADYYLFTDAGPEPCYVYRVVPAPYFDEDPTRSARFVKTHAHMLLPHYRTAVWVDGNILIRDDLGAMIRRFEQSGLPVAAVPHPVRASVYEEAEECIRLNKDDAQRIEAQMARYRAEGFDCDDLIESNFMMFRLDHPQLAPFLDGWWSEIERGSRRDQLSFNYAMRKAGASWFPLTQKPDSVRNHPALALFHHGSLVPPSMPALRPPAGPQRSYAEVMAERLERHRQRTADIVVCVHNALDAVTRCLTSVAASRDPARHRIVIVDDGSDPATRTWLAHFASRLSNVELIRHDTAEGYTRAANAGLRVMRGDLAILLNSDTEVAGRWIDKLLDAAFSNPGVGIVGPLSSAASHQSIPDHKGTATQTAINAMPSGCTVADMDAWCARHSPCDFVPRVPLVHGFCFGVTREAVRRVGYFDDLNFPFGYGEENDYCFRAADAGVSLAIATHTYVYHQKSQSYPDERRQALVKAGSVKLRELHGKERVRRAVSGMQSNPHLMRLRTLAAGLYAAQGRDGIAV